MRAIVRNRLTLAREIEATPARLASHVTRRIVIDQFNRLMAMRTANLHESCLKNLEVWGSAPAAEPTSSTKLCEDQTRLRCVHAEIFEENQSLHGSKVCPRRRTGVDDRSA